MPVLHIRALPQNKPEQIQQVLKQTAQAIAEAFGCPPHHVWITWEKLEPGYYLEGDTTASQQPLETHPPIAQLICFEGKSPAQIEAVLVATSKALSEGLGIAGNVFITYHEAKSGQVIAGNGIVRKK